MPDRFRLLLSLAVAGTLAACAGTTTEAPSSDAADAAATDATAAATGAPPTDAPARAGAGPMAGADPEDLDPATRRRVELWQVAMGQIEPCLRPRLNEIDNVDAAGTVAVQVEYDEAGAPVSADLQEGARARIADNETYRAVVNAILNSVQECAPLTDMPEEEFDTWRLFPVVVRPRPA
jgi:hypothetical protein